MNTHTTYTTKAEKYAKYRWDYAPGAVEAIFAIAQVTRDSIVADIGAGTGILTRHFIGKVRQVVAIEPNVGMRREAARRLPLGPGCAILAGCAEQVPLRDHSIDLITVAQAIQWCDPEPTRTEFLRALRPGGWLALVRNFQTESEAGKALEEVCTAGNGVCDAKGPPPAYQRSKDFFFRGRHYQKLVFPFSYQQDWESYIGALCSTSYIPDEDHPAYPRFEKAVRRVFDRFSSDGLLAGNGETELLIGQVS
jgi:SAM-dependent methyltransferase